MFTMMPLALLGSCRILIIIIIIFYLAHTMNPSTFLHHPPFPPRWPSSRLPSTPRTTSTWVYVPYRNCSGTLLSSWASPGATSSYHHPMSSFDEFYSKIIVINFFSLSFIFFSRESKKSALYFIFFSISFFNSIRLIVFFSISYS